jgi:neurabin
VSLVSHKSLAGSDLGANSSADAGGITLISSKPIDTGYGGKRDKSNSLSSLGSTQSGMVSEYDMSSRQSYDFASATLTNDEFGSRGSLQEESGSSLSSGATKRSVQYQSAPVPEWSCQQVCHWLLAINMDQYAPQFISHSIDGQQLLLLDSARLKTIGIQNAKDRDLIKRKAKDLKSAIERERKQIEKEQKARDKLEKQAGGPAKKKKFPFTK